MSSLLDCQSRLALWLYNSCMRASRIFRLSYLNKRSQILLNFLYLNFMYSKQRPDLIMKFADLLLDLHTICKKLFDIRCVFIATINGKAVVNDALLVDVDRCRPVRNQGRRCRTHSAQHNQVGWRSWRYWFGRLFTIHTFKYVDCILLLFMSDAL